MLPVSRSVPDPARPPADRSSVAAVLLPPRTSVPPDTSAGPIKYKFGVYKSNVGGVPVSSVFPSGAMQVAQKKKMLTTFQIPHFNGTTALVYPHNDYGVTQTGLTEGFHVLRARAFLKRERLSLRPVRAK